MISKIKYVIAALIIELSYLALKRIGAMDLANEDRYFFNEVKDLPVYNREEFILSQCANKRVLHLGCTDSPFTKKFLLEDRLLHQKLVNISDSVVGVDSSKKEIKYLQEELGLKDIYVLNVYELEKLSNLKKFDIILAGELIEHLENPGLMLASAAKLLTEKGIVLATVPNAYRYRLFFAVQRGIDLVHKEHTAWHSYHTIQRLFKICGYSNIKISGYIWGERWIGRRFLKHTPLFCDGLIVEAKP